MAKTTAKLCVCCGVRRPKTGSKGTETSPHNDMCNYCYEKAGYENQHSDHNHEAIQAEVDQKDGFTTDLSDNDKDEYESFMQTCWICHPELNLAKLPAGKKATGPKVQGDRRPQFNHKGHSHPQTPAARRACKTAFWAYHQTPVYGMDAQVAEAMVKWDFKCDGFGKPEAKQTAWKVVPRGPKGGVINQLKATKHLMKACTNAAHYDEIIESGMCSTCGKEK